MASTDFPSQPGIWVWDATACLWTRTTGIPFPTGVTGVYGWDGGGQRWVVVDGSGGEEMGVTDGSNALPGRVGEYLSASSNVLPGYSLAFSTRATDPALASDFTLFGSLSLSAGDWMVGAGIDIWSDTADPISQTFLYLGTSPMPFSPGVAAQRPDSGTFFVTGGDVNVGDSVSLGPVRVNSSTPTQVLLQGGIVTPGVSVGAGCDYTIWARRMR